MFSVFDKLDATIIRLAQYIVHQIELYTPLKRSNIGRLLIFFCIPLVLLKVMLGVTVPYSDYSTPLKVWILFFFPVLTYSDFNLLKAIDRVSKEERTKQLPNEIVAEAKARKAALYAFFILNCFIFIQQFMSGGTILAEMRKWNLIYLLFIWVPISKAYFCCMMSLPPGKKSRKKQEREARKLVAIPSVV